jgi:hypothetical protein
MDMAKPGWGAVVLGEPSDLERWADQLKPDFDAPWVETHGSETLLRSPSFDELTSEGDVRDCAVALIARLNGALVLLQLARPLTFGGVVKIDVNGILHRTVFAEGNSYIWSGAAVALFIDDEDGNPLPSTVQRWSAVADNDTFLDDALIYFGKGADWYEVYKGFECLEDKFGGVRQFRALGWASKAKIELLKRTANSAARHKRGKFDPPPHPMSLTEARSLLAQLIERAFETISSARYQK